MSSMYNDRQTSMGGPSMLSKKDADEVEKQIEEGRKKAEEEAMLLASM